MGTKRKPREDDSSAPESISSAEERMAFELLNGEVVGGTLSQIAAYSDLFHKMIDGVFLVERKNFRILECNRAGLELLTSAPQPVVGKPILSWVVERDRITLEKYLKGASQSNEAQQPVDALFLMGSKKVFLEISACNLKLARNIEVLQLVAKDVTAIRQAQRSLEELTLKLEKASVTDEMTGLSNFRRFQAQLEKEHVRALRYKHPYAILFCDVDHFKKYNDQNGHPEGDEVLRGTAKIIEKHSRTTDLAARYGGEEFVVLCPNTDTQTAYALAERIRIAIANEAFTHREKQPLGCVSVSIGIASFPSDGEKPSEILERADQALYQSKTEGRNRTTCFGQLPKARLSKKAA
ncbi:MAG: sensor domain-containing diguanylate cyclase [Bdellovibrionota bacterium]